jgi:hypothetical protein
VHRHNARLPGSGQSAVGGTGAGLSDHRATCVTAESWCGRAAGIDGPTWVMATYLIADCTRYIPYPIMVGWGFRQTVGCALTSIATGCLWGLGANVGWAPSNMVDSMPCAQPGGELVKWGVKGLGSVRVLRSTPHMLWQHRASLWTTRCTSYAGQLGAWQRAASHMMTNTLAGG